MTFLRHYGFACEPIDIKQRRAKTYDTEAPVWNGLNYRNIYALAADNPVTRGTGLYAHAFVIVALDPTIIVIAPGLVGAGEFVDLVPSGPMKQEQAIAIGLPHGLLYDDRVPRVGDLRWCAPDLGVPPTPIFFPDDGAGEIPVPWGTLRLVPRGELYNIEAEQGIPASGT